MRQTAIWMLTVLALACGRERAAISPGPGAGGAGGAIIVAAEGGAIGAGGDVTPVDASAADAAPTPDEAPAVDLAPAPDLTPDAAADVAPACMAAGQLCSSDRDCCADTYCLNWQYGVFKCLPKLAEGATCERKNQCTTGLCSRSTCVACIPAAGACAKDADCCAGNFCDNEGYAPYRCMPLLPVNRYCLRDSACQSQHCVNRGCVAAPAAASPRRIFHHRNGALGDLGDAADTRPVLEIADAACAQGAAQRQLGGIWKAWLSTSTVNAIDRIADVGPWYRLDGVTKLFENRAQLAVGPLAPIDTPGDRLAGSPFWTGTLADGTRSGLTCGDWTQDVTGTATVGRADAVGAAWVQAEPISCGYYGGILCIEQ